MVKQIKCHDCKRFYQYQVMQPDWTGGVQMYWDGGCKIKKQKIDPEFDDEQKIRDCNKFRPIIGWIRFLFKKFY